MTLRHSNGIRIRSQLFGLPLAEVSINIRASHSVVLKARLYWVVPISSRNIVTSKLSEILLQKGLFTSHFILHCELITMIFLFIYYYYYYIIIH